LTHFTRGSCKPHAETIKRKSPESNFKKDAKQWVNYLTASRALKIIREEHPSYLNSNFFSNYFEES